MVSILAALLLSALPCSGSTTPRSAAAVKAFKAANPCPNTCRTYVRQGSRFVLYEVCGACEIDHICPLACCGLDAPQNMQWLSKKENRAKGANCSLCGPALPK